MPSTAPALKLHARRQIEVCYPSATAKEREIFTVMLRRRASTALSWIRFNTKSLNCAGSKKEQRCLHWI